MKQILKCFFSIYLVLCSIGLQAQVKDSIIIRDISKPFLDTLNTSKIDTSIVKINRYGLRVGIDLYKLVRSIYDDDYKGVEFVSDYRLSKNYYLAAEMGYDDKTTFDDQLTSNSKGQYIKLGFDYNTYDNWLNMENIISIGLRYGFSTFGEELINYDIYNRYPYWEENDLVITNKNYNGLTASWIEVVVGFKAKIFNNVFIGISAQLKGLITNNKPTDFDNLYIPGFNRTYNGNFGAGFNYTISYLIPIYKKKIKITETK